MKRKTLLKLCLTGLTGLFFLGDGSQAQAKTFKVATTTNFYQEVAKEVLGKKGSVSALINNPNADPHDFEPTTKTAKTVAQADLVIYNGIGYDSWVKKLSAKKYLSVAGLVGKKDGDNEHIWYNVKAMKELTRKLATYFAKADKKNAQVYHANAQAYIKKLDQLTKLERKIAKSKDKKQVLVSEPVFDYALKSMGYTVSNRHFAKATEEGSDPSFSDLEKVQDAIKSKKVAFFVYNTQSDSTIIANVLDLCKKNKVPIIKVTETKPKGLTYTAWLRKELKQIEALQK